MKNTAMNILIHVFGACLHTFLLGIYPGVKLLSHRTCKGSTLEDDVKQFYKMVVPLFTLTSSV